MQLIRRLAALAAVATLVPVAAFSNPTVAVASAVAGTMTVVPDNCAACSAGIVGSNGYYTARWSIGGVCTSWESCALCLPTCEAAGALNGTWTEAVSYYDRNSCETWACWATSPENLAALKAADASALAIAVQRPDGHVRYNRDRKAIQVYDCRGLVTAHLPLPDERAMQLARLVQ